MNKHDELYMAMARTWAGASYSRKRRVGALIVRGRRIISDGYNGAPAGLENVCEDWSVARSKWVTRPETLHAEANALLKLTRSAETAEGATLYVTVAPCVECAKLITQAGISRVVYGEENKPEGLDLLRKVGVEVDYVESGSESRVAMTHKPAQEPMLDGTLADITDESDKYKFDSGKRQWHLLPTRELGQVADVLTMGAKKYEPFSWQKVYQAKTRYYDALVRHLTAWIEGERFDPESGKNHLTHVVCNALFLLWFDNENEK